MSTAPESWWNGSEVARVLTTAVGGLIVAGALVAFAPWEVTVLSAWIVAAGSFVARTWARIHGLDAEETEAVALTEDNSRASAHVMVVGASVISLAGVGATLGEASHTAGGQRVLFSVVAILTVATSWLLVHTVFTLRYAHGYYTAPVGGVDFKSKQDTDTPDYHDFAYLAFTVGMTFQVSDTDLTTSAMRRLALRHALLSYLFGAVILAMTINITAGFIL